MRLKAVQFLAVVLTAIALVPSGAHVFALANKITLGAEQYFIVQNIYRGWSLFGIVWIGALIANLRARGVREETRVGQSVVHPKFGAGVIVNAEGRGMDARVQVNFRNSGLKWLMLEYANLAPA